MILSSLKVLSLHGWQAIKRLERVRLSDSFRGRPELTAPGSETASLERAAALCPTGAIAVKPRFTLDMGKCLFCGECARISPENIRFSNEHRISSLTREGLIVSTDGQPEPILSDDPRMARVRKLFRRSLQLREVSAGGDNSCEMELNASGNVNFDAARLGIGFTASPRHADGMVITGPITRSMARETEITWQAIPEPKILIAAGSDAISGGLFADSPAVDRSFFDRHPVDLYVPGNPVHPMTFITGVMLFLGK